MLTEYEIKKNKFNKFIKLLNIPNISNVYLNHFDFIIEKKFRDHMSENYNYEIPYNF